MEVVTARLDLDSRCTAEPTASHFWVVDVEPDGEADNT